VADWQRWDELGKTIISVDPGHKNIVTAVRHYHPSRARPAADVPAAPAPRVSKRVKRRLARERRERDAHQSVYVMRNRHWHDRTGHLSSARTLRRWRVAAGVNGDYGAEELLASSADGYVSGLRKLAPLWEERWAEGRKLKYRRQRFRLYQREQREVARICRELCGGIPVKDCVVLWGNGSFGPTFHGYAAAPNVGLRTKLAQHGLEIRMVNEHYTSQYAACCLEKSRYTVQSEEPTRRMLEYQGPRKLAMEQHVERRRSKLKRHGLLYCHPSADSAQPRRPHVPVFCTNVWCLYERYSQDGPHRCRHPRAAAAPAASPTLLSVRAVNDSPSASRAGTAAHEPQQPSG
jgi:hypothetical protein